MIKIDNNLGKSFGPSAAFAGYVLFVTGLIMIKWIAGIIVLLLGAFLGFTRSGVSIEKENNRFKYYTKLFGIFKIGKWNDLSRYKNIAILSNRRVYTVYSRSNRTLDLKEKNYLIYILSSNRRQKVPIMKCKNMKIAQIEAEKLSKKLNMTIIKN